MCAVEMCAVEMHTANACSCKQLFFQFRCAVGMLHASPSLLDFVEVASRTTWPIDTLKVVTRTNIDDPSHRPRSLTRIMSVMVKDN